MGIYDSLSTSNTLNQNIFFFFWAQLNYHNFKFACHKIILLYYFESPVGNIDVLLANIGILTLSSIFCTFTHIYKNLLFLLFTLILGFVFILNQLDESFSIFNFNLNSEYGSIIFILYIHLSHLILCSVLFISIIMNSAINYFSYSTLTFFLV